MSHFSEQLRKEFPEPVSGPIRVISGRLQESKAFQELRKSCPEKSSKMGYSKKTSSDPVNEALLETLDGALLAGEVDIGRFADHLVDKALGSPPGFRDQLCKDLAAFDQEGTGKVSVRDILGLCKKSQEVAVRTIDIDRFADHVEKHLGSPPGFRDQLRKYLAECDQEGTGKVSVPDILVLEMKFLDVGGVVREILGELCEADLCDIADTLVGNIRKIVAPVWQQIVGKIPAGGYLGKGLAGLNLYTALGCASEIGAQKLITKHSAHDLKKMGFHPGCSIIINPGKVNEERCKVKRLGSIHTVGPLQQAHAQDEPVVLAVEEDIELAIVMFPDEPLALQEARTAYVKINECNLLGASAFQHCYKGSGVTPNPGAAHVVASLLNFGSELCRQTPDDAPYSFSEDAVRNTMLGDIERNGLRLDPRFGGCVRLYTGEVYLGSNGQQPFLRIYDVLTYTLSQDNLPALTPLVNFLQGLNFYLNDAQHAGGQYFCASNVGPEGMQFLASHVQQKVRIPRILSTSVSDVFPRARQQQRNLEAGGAQTCALLRICIPQNFQGARELGPDVCAFPEERETLFAAQSAFYVARVDVANMEAELRAIDKYDDSGVAGVQVHQY